MAQLAVIIGSTRTDRVGPVVADWFADRARAHGAFEVETIDLAEVDLPFLDEPRMPRLGGYAHDHTRRWSERVAGADAYVLVTPEYNHGTSPALLNAIDFLFAEWNYKPAGFVSYGGPSAGMRSVQSLKPVLTGVRMMPIPESVSIPFIGQHLTDGVLSPPPFAEAGVAPMLDELAKWSRALATMR
jgi:NAD(P)H-dependent FMN reductase